MVSDYDRLADKKQDDGARSGMRVFAGLRGRSVFSRNDCKETSLYESQNGIEADEWMDERGGWRFVAEAEDG
jgi:hypothetical protein